MDAHTHATPETQPGPTVLIIFGAGGDLTFRKLLPALFNLRLDRYLGDRFAIVGLDRQPWNDDDFRQKMREGIDTFSRQGKSRDVDWNGFGPGLSYIRGDFKSPDLYAQLKEKLAAQDRAWGGPVHHVFYLATSPVFFGLIGEQLGKAGLMADPQRHRLVVEKPFGRDLASARELNHTLTSIMEEAQIYRIDHYLGKETVQNLLAFRFANTIFEPIWNRNFIDHVQITVAEEVGVEQRGGYYDQSGALRDMIQNHLFRILGLLAMEPPVSLDADEIRNKKTDVLKALRPIPRDQVAQFAVRGQYGAGTVEGKKVADYRHEPNVKPQSATETYAAVKLFVDTWRWQDVPFYLRTGKAMAARVAEASIVFRQVAHRSFPPNVLPTWLPNRLAVRIQPGEGIVLRFQSKIPGPTMRLRPVDMHFLYEEEFACPSPEGYETLLLDAMLGEATLFMRADMVEIAWAAVTPILEAWVEQTPDDFPNYAAGSWGPAAADALLARDGRAWLLPTALEVKDRECRV